MITLRYSEFFVGLIALEMIIYVQQASCVQQINYSPNYEFCNRSRKKFIVPQTLNDANPVIVVNSQEKFQMWPTNPNDYCDFVIKTEPGKNGIFAVIQSISFRSSSDGKCIDSITLKRDDLHESKFCGSYNRRSEDLRHRGTNLFSSTSFNYGEFDPTGQIRTIVNISDQKFSSNSDFQIGFVIAYTMYRDCNGTDPNLYRRVVRDHDICIRKELFCDGIYNCGGMEYCLDEEMCDNRIHVVSSEIGTKVTVAVVTTILHIFVIFIVCLWICRRQKKLCWSTDCAGPSPDQNTPALSLDIDHRNPNNLVASAPMLEEALTNSVHDKDLPPSYDSLFPENANLANP